MNGRDTEIIRRRNQRHEKAGAIAAALDIPVSRVWRALATFWEAETHRAQGEAVAIGTQLWNEKVRKIPAPGWTAEQSVRLRQIVREPALARRLALLDLPLDQELPPADVIDLRHKEVGA